MKLHFLIIISLVQLFQTLYGQSRIISGTVFPGEIRQGVAGVLVKTKKLSVQTDSKGRYRIAASEGDTLVFSGYGFHPKQLIAGSEDTLDVLVNTHQIVTPYGTADQEEFTGSAVLIRPYLWNNCSFTNLLLALQGAGAGVRTTSPSGDPGSEPGVRIRGTSLLESAGPPLYIVDGVEFTGNFSDLNPGDIESITVLKDAVNRTLYGSRGLNGVVMIKTLTGAGIKSNFDFSLQTGTASNAVPGYNMVGPAEYYELSWQMYRNFLFHKGIPMDVSAQIASGVLPRDAAGRQVYNNEGYVDLIWMLGGYNAFNVADMELIGVDGKLNPAAVLRNPEELNWMDRVARTGRRNEYNMTYSTGRGKMDIMTSLNYLREEGWSNWSALERYAGRMNLNYQATRWFKAGLRLTASRNGSDHVNATPANALNPFYFARNIGPVYPVHIIHPETGERIYDIREITDSQSPLRPFYPTYHAILDNDRISDHTVRKLYSGRAFMNFTFLPWLRLDLNAGGDQSDSKQERISNDLRAGRSETLHKIKNNSYTLNQVLSIYKFYNDIEFSLVAGHENVFYNGKDSLITIINVSSDPANITASQNYYRIKQKQDSYFVKTGVGLFRRYYLEGAYRNDRYSGLTSSGSWSVAGSWNLAGEDFFNLSWMQEIRLYTTYGSSAGMYSFFHQHPFTVGTGFSMLKNRLHGSAEYYSTRVKDLISTPDLWLGTWEIFTGKQKNSGVELSLTSVLAERKRFSWTLTGNLTFQREVLTEMPAQIPVMPKGNFRLQKGVSGFSYYTRSFFGVDPESGLPLYRGVENYDPFNPAIKILETAGKKDTVTSDFQLARQSFIGKSASPAGYGSLINSLRYGNFDLNLLITYQFGGWAMDNQYMTAEFLGVNLHKDLLNAWKKSGDMTDIPRIDKADREFTAPSTRWLIRSDYVSLAGVKLSYHIPEKALPFMKITLFANAENVYFLTRRKGLNPLSFFEYNAGSGTYNFARKFNLGLNVKL